MSDAPSTLAAFGYTPEETVPVASVQVAEGKQPDSLQPVIVVYLRPGYDQSGPQIPFVMTVELAEALTDQLTHFTQRAHAKHWEPPAAPPH